MFIDVDKIVEKVKKDADGKPVYYDHDDRSKPIISGYNVFKETIRVDDIKSARPWEKNKIQRETLEGELTLLYLNGNSSKDTPAQMLILEDHRSFSERLGSKQVSNDNGI